MECAVARFRADDPISLIAAEIHHGSGPAGITGSWLEYLYSKHVPVQHEPKNLENSINYKFCGALSGLTFMPFQEA